MVRPAQLAIAGTAAYVSREGAQAGRAGAERGRHSGSKQPRVLLPDPVLSALRGRNLAGSGSAVSALFRRRRGPQEWNSAPPQAPPPLPGQGVRDPRGSLCRFSASGG
ncbi:hypothetical protein lerEdw1_005087 [Lerista edwardsae]|nr:hypothetical protein lerEdw1_005087 [Lerista edwardsae]